MCGRFTLHHPVAKIVQRFHVTDLAFSPEPRYNIAPGEVLGAIVTKAGGHTLESFRWGLIPPPPDNVANADNADRKPLINVRIESLGRQKSLKGLFERQRCLIPADGFYEWKSRTSPFYFHRRDHDLFAIAGIWDEGKPTGDPAIGPMRMLTIVTTEADELVGPIHNRMPLLLPQDKEESWLDPSVENPADLGKWTKGEWADILESYRVSMLVNRSGTDSPGMIQRVEPEMTLFGQL